MIFYIDAKLVYLEGFYRVLDQQEICIQTEKLIYKLYIDKNRPCQTVRCNVRLVTDDKNPSFCAFSNEQ